MPTLARVSGSVLHCHGQQSRGDGAGHWLTGLTENDWGPASVNITQEGDFYDAEYDYKLTPLWLVKPIVWIGAGVGKVF
jgi:hypothetical protein